MTRHALPCTGRVAGRPLRQRPTRYLGLDLPPLFRPRRLRCERRSPKARQHFHAIRAICREDMGDTLCEPQQAAGRDGRWRARLPLPISLHRRRAMRSGGARTIFSFWSDARRPAAGFVGVCCAADKIFAHERLSPPRVLDGYRAKPAAAGIGVFDDTMPRDVHRH